jgi:Probable cobalt transporter subunit (CbtB)
MSSFSSQHSAPSHAETAGASKAALAAVVALFAVVLALLALYAVFLDQGQLLSPVLGQVAVSANYVHEFVHDGRHLLGAPCH